MFPGVESDNLGPMLLMGQVDEKSDHWINDMTISGDLVNRSFCEVVGMEGGLEWV